MQKLDEKGGSATFASHGSCKGFAQDIECEMGILGLDYIEEYLLDHMGSDFAVSCGIKVFGDFECWARFEEPDDENDDYKHFVQAKGQSLEEVVRKIATYIDSGKTYNDGRYIE